MNFYYSYDDGDDDRLGKNNDYYISLHIKKKKKIGGDL
jgi:hypothetical protein